MDLQTLEKTLCLVSLETGLPLTHTDGTLLAFRSDDMARSEAIQRYGTLWLDFVTIEPVTEETLCKHD